MLLSLFLPLVIALAIVVHEVAHGWVAYKLGDPTAKDLGRLTLNPMKHVSLFGSIILPLFLYLAKSPVLFAYAKPVPINPHYFKKPFRDMAWVAMAGPASNFLMAFGFAAIFRLFPIYPFLQALCIYGVLINLILGLFNLVPIPPLDGSRLVSALLPKRLNRVYARLEILGLIIVFVLLSLGLLEFLFIPIFSAAEFLLGQHI